MHRAGGRGEAFYRDCLEYGQALWQRGYAARSLLCLDRAMGAELSVLKTPRGIELARPDDAFEEQMAVAREVMQRRRRALRELAK